jgi:anhydro-N-acetylmuramic acid kinase
MSNLTILPTQGEIIGFDCGPCNVLLDYWVQRHIHQPYDDSGKFAASGNVHEPLLKKLLDEPYLGLTPPKSTGRDTFNAAWLHMKLLAFDSILPADVQATLTAFIAATIAQDITKYAPECQTIYMCGGGAKNATLLDALRQALKIEKSACTHVEKTDVLGISVDQVEACAFAWLAMRFLERKPGNIPFATGATGERILGALYPGKSKP